MGMTVSISESQYFSLKMNFYVTIILSLSLYIYDDDILFFYLVLNPRKVSYSRRNSLKIFCNISVEC